MDRRRGFTLVELSVVMAIVAVVSVLAFPTFFGWMERERFRGDVREFAEAVKAERSWAAMNLPSGIIVDEWGYTVARRGESPVVHDYADGITATSNLLTPIVRIDSYGGAQFDTPADEQPDGTEIQQPARVVFTDGDHTMTVEITLGGQAVLAGGAE
jgi:prepilin-type N-terminal cleavage/methylation domain-containing protein